MNDLLAEAGEADPCGCGPGATECDYHLGWWDGYAAATATNQPSPVNSEDKKMKPEIRQLTTEDRAGLRLPRARLESMKLNPHPYSRTEIEEAHLSMWAFEGDVVERYEIDDTRVWTISTSTGQVFVGDGYEPQ